MLLDYILGLSMQTQKKSIRQTPMPYYVGVNRRTERRQSKEPEFERMLKMFGLDRRIIPDRRQANSSWLLIPDKVSLETKRHLS